MIEKSISLVMYGIRKCSGACLYCSAASTMNYNEDGNKNTFKFDKEKTKKRILEYTNVEEDLKENQSISLKIDIWGGNPLENFSEFKQVVEFCQNELKEFKEISLHTSGNGLELRDNEKVQYLIDNNIHYQLSHDGCGQFIRTGLIDPLYWDKTKDNIVKLVRLGFIDWVNTTLSARNFSFFENMEYWNKWRRENDLMECTSKNFTIKLNHIYEGTPPITKKWLFDDYQTEYKCVVPPKKGEEIGDLNFHGTVLNTYMHEFMMAALMVMNPGIEDNPEWAPFKGYLLSQSNRYKIIENENDFDGSCRKFQMGLADRNFAIDTIGEYCQCNLIDSSVTVKNPEGTRPKECDTCEYKMMSECYPCGSEIRTKCEWTKEFVRVLIEFEQIRQLIDAKLNAAFNKEVQNFDCKKNNEPVFCVKNYNF